MSASVLMSVCICNNSVSLFQCIYCLIKLDYRWLVNIRQIFVLKYSEKNCFVILPDNVYIHKHACVLSRLYHNYTVADVYNWNIPEFKMLFGLTCQQPCYKVTLDSEKGRMDKARKNG